VRRFLVALLPSVLLACGASPRGADGTRFLRVGVEPAAEADAVIGGLARGGWQLSQRQDGRSFVALAFAHEQPADTAIRVITVRGIAFVLDGSNLDPTGELSLAPRPSGGDADIDGDGREEIIVARGDQGLGRRCLLVLRVTAPGVVVPIGAEPVRVAADECIEDLADVNGDGHPEAMVILRLYELARGPAPTVTLPLVLERDRFRPPPAVMLRRWLVSERGRRAGTLAEARRALDVERAYLIAVELAALARHAGEAVSAQLTAFDGALLGLVLSPSQARSVAAARQQIISGWPLPEGGGEAAPTDS